MGAPRILFLGDPQPDYVGDGLFHGLRTLLGDAVVDVAERGPMYRGRAGEADYGRGFGLYGLLPAVDVDRADVWDQDWDLVVTGVLWRDWHWWEKAWARFGSSVRHAVVDGADLHWAYPYGPAWWRPTRWTVPRTHRRATYFKREWSALTMIAAGRRLELEPLGISYPAEKVVDAVPDKTQEFATHVVDLEVGERLSRRLRHERELVFNDEAEYLADLRASRFGVTTKRAGWDALRHLEIAAAGAIPCFRRLEDKPSTCAPHGLRPGENCLSYREADDLFAQTKALGDGRAAELAEGALAWARENTTVRRAERFLERALA
jgi:hypothetical protein